MTMLHPDRCTDQQGPISGGPTFGMDGDVIGVNTANLLAVRRSVGIGFDIPPTSQRMSWRNSRRRAT